LKGSLRALSATAIVIAAACNSILGNEEGVFVPATGDGGEDASGGTGGRGGAGGKGGTSGKSAGGAAGQGQGGSTGGGAGAGQGGESTGGEAGSSSGASGGSSGGLGGSTGGSTTSEGGAGGEEPVDPCEAQPCVHGTCSSSGTDYTCACTAGYDGPNCDNDIDDCATVVCNNGGVCIDGIESATCDCSGTGYSGTGCDTLVQNCAQSPCLNGGTCTDVGASRTCACPAGYEGDSCEINHDDCNPDPCLNGGTCVDGVNTYTCTCQAPWHGLLCDTGNLAITCSNGGWWDSTGKHNDGNQNTFTGYGSSGGVHFNSFLVFQIPNFTGRIGGLVLHLFHEGYNSPNGTEQIQTWDVSTPIGTLLADGVGETEIYDDLMSGALYRGSFPTTEATVGTHLDLTLNMTAAADILAARGGRFALGFHLLNYSGQTTQNENARWSGGAAEIPNHELRIDVIP